MNVVKIDGAKVVTLSDFVREFIQLTGVAQNKVWTEIEIAEMKEKIPSFELPKRTPQETSDFLAHLDRFNDWCFEATSILGEFVLVIQNSDQVRSTLGYQSYIDFQQKNLDWCVRQAAVDKAYQKNVEELNYKINLAKEGMGDTLFSMVINIILQNQKINLRLE